jgi:hypothetical protein
MAPRVAQACRRRLFRRRIDAAERVLAGALGRLARHNRFLTLLRRHHELEWPSKATLATPLQTDYRRLWVDADYLAPLLDVVPYGRYHVAYTSDPDAPIQDAWYMAWLVVHHASGRVYEPPLWCTCAADVRGFLIANLSGGAKRAAWRPSVCEPKPLHLWTADECRDGDADSVPFWLFGPLNALVDEYTVTRSQQRRLVAAGNGYDLAVAETKTWWMTYPPADGGGGKASITVDTNVSTRSGVVRSHVISVDDGARRHVSIELDGRGGARPQTFVDGRRADLPDGAFHAYQYVRTLDGRDAVLKALITPRTCQVTSSAWSNKLRGGAGTVGIVLAIRTFERVVASIGGRLLTDAQAAQVTAADVEACTPVVYYRVRYGALADAAMSAVYGHRHRYYAPGDVVTVAADDFDAAFAMDDRECGRGWSFHLTQLEALTWAGIPNITPAWIDGYDALCDLVDVARTAPAPAPAPAPVPIPAPIPSEGEPMVAATVFGARADGWTTDTLKQYATTLLWRLSDVFVGSGVDFVEPYMDGSTNWVSADVTIPAAWSGKALELTHNLPRGLSVNGFPDVAPAPVPVPVPVAVPAPAPVADDDGGGCCFGRQRRRA